MRLEIDISPKEHEIVIGILQKHLKIPAKIWAFGSRVKNKAKRNSDLDLAIECFQKVGVGLLTDLEDAFTDAPLPYKVDIVVLKKVKPEFENIINQYKILLTVVGNIPKLRFPEFRNEWDKTTIGANCTLKGRIGYRGYTKQDLVEEGKGALVIGGKHIQNQQLDLTEPTFLKWEKYYESLEIMVEKGHIVFSQRGSLGDCALIKNDIGKATINPNMVLLKEITCNAEYMYYILIGKYIQKEVKRISTNTAVPMLSQKQIKEFNFYIPNPKEQQRIASCLSALDALITAHNEKLAALKTHKKGLLQNLFPQKGQKVPTYRFPEFRNDGEWVEKKLGQVGEFIGGGTPLTSNSEYWDGDIQWYTPTEVKSGVLNPSIRTITKEGLQNSSAKLLPIGAILITTRATIGDAAIANIECTTNQGFQSLVVNELEHNQFWYHWIVYHKDELIRRSSGSTFKEIGKTEIKLVPTLSPKKKEQQRIASCLSALDALITAQTDKIEKLQKHKKGLLQGLFPKNREVRDG